MAVISALRDAVDVLQRNPVLFAAAALYGAVQIPGWLLQVSGNPVLQLASSGYNMLLIFIMPFFMGGLLAMAYDGLSTSTSLSRLWTGGKTYYLRLLAASLILMVVYFVIAIGIGFLVFALFLSGVVGNGGGIGSISLTVLAVVGIIGLLFALVLLAIGFFLQFYAQAVVVDDLGIVDSLKRSYRVVRQNLAAVLGFDILGLVLGGLAGLLPLAYMFFVGSGFEPMGAASWGVRIGFVVLSIVVTIVLGAFGTTFAVAFYDRISERKQL